MGPENIIFIVRPGSLPPLKTGTFWALVSATEQRGLDSLHSELQRVLRI
jgi:hypothetical protein